MPDTYVVTQKQFEVWASKQGGGGGRLHGRSDG